MVDLSINEIQWATGMCSWVNIVVCFEATFPSTNQIRLREGFGISLQFINISIGKNKLT